MQRVIHFPEQLPISGRVADIAAAMEKHQVVIVAGATGSGKTTQLPKIALSLGRERIGVTQPRRIAATSVAARVAQELGGAIGGEVGYQIRFDERTSRQTRIKFMTDGILLAEIQGDRRLSRYDTVIIDEAHERSLTIDFLLGWLKRILPERPDLKVLVSSATIETDRFSAFFGGAPVVQVEGRTFPVEVLYEPPSDEDDMTTAVANAVESVISLDPDGDVLVFLPGEREIREAEGELNGRRLRNTVIQPLYARLSAADQGKVFASIPQRRVILATNVAETSITLPGIVYVIDTGVARLSRYEPRSGTTRLQIEAISQASAEQRKGRCGRVRDGICMRLYDEASYLTRSPFTDPEIKRTGLAGVILRMKSLQLGDVEQFPFLDPPHSRAVSEGYRVLEELGAIDDRKELTGIGHRLAQFPADPRIGRMILAGAERGCLREILVITAALSTMDPRERPREVQQKADDAHRRFRDERSDFTGLLKLWAFIKEAEKKGSSNLRRTCRENFLSFMRVREWNEVHRQLEDVARDLRLPIQQTQASEEQIHRALATGLLSKVGLWSPEKRAYFGAKQTRFMVHPSSALAKKPPAWLMAFELVETTQLFARMAAKVEPEWLLDAGEQLVKRSYSEAHWSERAARASVKETCTLFGLIVAKDRSVDYASIDPAGARRMFLDYALVRGEYKTKGIFQQKNRALFDEVARLRDKARRSDMFTNDEALLAFFDQRVPAEVVNGKTFEEWRERAEKRDPSILLLSLDDLFTSEDRSVSAADYPDHIVLHGTKLALSYLFDPSADDDGITISIPLVLLPQLDPGELDWMVRGWHKDKIEAMLETLQKSIRRELGPIEALSRTLAAKLQPFAGPMIPALAKAVGVEEKAFQPDRVVPYLRLTCRLIDEQGRTVDSGRDIAALFQRHGQKARAVLQSATPATEHKGMTSWLCGDLAPFVVRRVSHVEVRSYPALVDRGQAVDVVLLESASSAATESRAGVRRLLMLGSKQALSTITPRLPAAFAKASGAPNGKAADDAFRTLLLARIVDETFGDTAPRTKDAFDAMLARGTPRLHATSVEIIEHVKAAAAELDKAIYALRIASKHPSGKAAIDDMFAQIELLFPSDLLRTIPLAQLAHYPRYLKAMQARLQRAVNDPKKDADKLAPIVQLWKAFAQKREQPADVRWLFEELRVAVFAPELKTAVPVTPQKLQAAVNALKSL